MGVSADESFHVGLTPDVVIDAAVALTRESHLLTWSIRDLARRLGVNPSTIYHHVGGKDLLCRRVVERVAERLVTPDPALEWQDWFRTLLFEMGPIVMEYPGTAKWILMHGPTVPAILPAMGSGFIPLSRAGFGEHLPRVIALLVNTATTTIAMGDDRLQHEEDGPRDHAAMMRDFERMTIGIPQAEGFARAMIRPFAAGGQASHDARVAYYRFAINITITGLETWLTNGMPDLEESTTAP
ncbi:TetR/AcrR family transcriptional regulator [Microbacterium sp.]|uniref:TetR/AcrR family transcriptional regulator n=1 Tax=Microbacterium sp. TaxID=51671 RepID=UPI003C768FE2